jgi:hypothetical protein
MTKLFRNSAYSITFYVVSSKLFLEVYIYLTYSIQTFTITDTNYTFLHTEHHLYITWHRILCQPEVTIHYSVKINLFTQCQFRIHSHSVWHHVALWQTQQSFRSYRCEMWQWSRLLRLLGFQNSHVSEPLTDGVPLPASDNNCTWPATDTKQWLKWKKYEHINLFRNIHFR